MAGGYFHLDWTGLPVGADPPAAGYAGILDWTGLPCGMGTPPVPPVGPQPIFLSGGFPLEMETGSKRRRRRDPGERERDDEEALLLLL